MTTGAASLTVEGEATDYAGAFIDSNGNISSRPRTSAQVSWNPAPWGTARDAGPDQRTPDISAIIQEIVNRPGWSSGNSLAILITGTLRKDLVDELASERPDLVQRVSQLAALMATSRLRLVSSARYTSPIPPWPIFSRTL